MTTDPVRAFAIRLKDGTLEHTASGALCLYPTNSPLRLAEGESYVEYIALPDDPASRAVREAEQRVLEAVHGFTMTGDNIHEDELREAYDALLAARKAKESGNGD